MHIPDNYLSPSTCVTFGAIMLPVWKKAEKKIKEEITRKKLPIIGICAAFSFMIMMFNIPLPGGTTGHAVGAALAAILLGPYAAVMAITIALAIQALFFGDGGILAFAVNCFNMAFVMPFTAYYIFNFFKNKISDKKGEYLGAFIAGYISLNIAALLTAVLFGIQPILFKDASGMPLYAPYGLEVAIPAMMIPHLLVAGFVEAFVTASVYVYIKKLSPEIIYSGKKINVKPIYILLLVMILLSPLGLLATGTAWGEWGMEEVKELTGFMPKGMEEGIAYSAIIPDYSIAGLNEIVSYVLSAIAGVALIFAIIKLVDLYKSSKKGLASKNID